MRSFFDHVTPAFIVSLVLLGTIGAVLYSTFSGADNGQMEKAAAKGSSAVAGTDRIRTEARCSGPEQRAQQACAKAVRKGR